MIGKSGKSGKFAEEQKIEQQIGDIKSQLLDKITVVQENKNEKEKQLVCLQSLVDDIRISLENKYQSLINMCDESANTANSLARLQTSVTSLDSLVSKYNGFMDDIVAKCRQDLESTLNRLSDNVSGL